jgi:hypothetical protein
VKRYDFMSYLLVQITRSRSIQNYIINYLLLVVRCAVL